jgi:hypothetical protein
MLPPKSRFNAQRVYPLDEHADVVAEYLVESLTTVEDPGVLAEASLYSAYSAYLSRIQK